MYFRHIWPIAKKGRRDKNNWLFFTFCSTDNFACVADNLEDEVPVRGFFHWAASACLLHIGACSFRTADFRSFHFLRQSSTVRMATRLTAFTRTQASFFLHTLTPLCNLHWVTGRSTTSASNRAQISLSVKFAFRSRFLVAVMIIDNYGTIYKLFTTK